MMSSIPTPSVLVQKQALANVIAASVKTTDARNALREDINKITQATTLIRENFKLVGARLRVVDLQPIDGETRGWYPIWQPLRTKYESILTLSKESASGIAAYGEQFEKVILRLHFNSALTMEQKMKVVDDFVRKADGFTGTSNTIASEFDSLSEDLDLFKKNYSHWLETLALSAQTASAQIVVIDDQITSLKEKISNLKLQIGTITAIGGAFGTLGAALGLLPTFTILIMVAAFAVLALAISKLSELRELSVELAAKKREKAALVQNLESIFAILQDVDLAVVDQIEDIRAGVSLFQVFWQQVVVDCKEISAWMRAGAEQSNMPPVQYAYVQQGVTLYNGLSEALHLYVKGITS